MKIADATAESASQQYYANSRSSARNEDTVSCQPKSNRSQPPNYSNYASEAELQKIEHVNDWLCWSIFTALCTCGLPGLIALAFSITCRSKKKINDYESAKLMSKLACAFNGFLTLLTVITWILMCFFFVNADTMRKGR